MTEPSGEPVEQLADRRDGQATPQPTSEFYAPPAPRDLGDPAADYPGTLRVERWEDRYWTGVRRAVRSDDGPRWTWVVFTGGAGEVGEFLSDDEVRTWPVCPSAVTHAAYELAGGRAPREGLVQPAERGDMDVDAFAHRRRGRRGGRRAGSR